MMWREMKGRELCISQEEGPDNFGRECTEKNTVRGVFQSIELIRSHDA